MGCLLFVGVVGVYGVGDCYVGIDDYSIDLVYVRYYQQMVNWGGCLLLLFIDGSIIQCVVVIVLVDWVDLSQGDIIIGIFWLFYLGQYFCLLLVNVGGLDNFSVLQVEMFEQLQLQVQIDYLVIGVDLCGISDGLGMQVSCDYVQCSGVENFMDGDSCNFMIESFIVQQDWWNCFISICLQQYVIFFKGISIFNYVCDLNLVCVVLGFKYVDLFGVFSGSSFMVYVSCMFLDWFECVVFDSNMDWVYLDWQWQVLCWMVMDQLNVQQVFIFFIV